MTHDEFLEAIRVAIEKILYSKPDVTRLDLSDDIVRGWRRYLDNKIPAKMAELVEQVAKDNKIPLASYEADTSKSEADRVRTAAEMILCTVDGAYRQMLTRPN